MFGSKNSLILDQNHEVLIQLRGSKYKSYADFFIPPVVMAKQHLANLRRNIGLFLKHDFHMDTGMKYLIQAFYRSIEEDLDVPIPYREIVLTSRIMDSIFDQVQSSRISTSRDQSEKASDESRHAADFVSAAH